MNSPTPIAPRLLCRLVRCWSALAGHDTFASGHGATCPECRAHFAAAAALDQRLRAPARHPASAPMPEGLEARLQAAVARELSGRPYARNARPPATWWLLPVAGATAALVALSVVFFRDAPEVPTIATTPPDNVSVPLVVSAPLENPALIWKIVGERATTWTEDNALQAEIRSVFTDTQSALRFLALNFLPDASAPTEAAPNRG